MDYGTGIKVDAAFDQTVEHVRAALKDQGFGILTEIDVQATMKEKLGEDMEPYLILGACNPPLAHRALGVDRQIGLLLPCNVVVRADGGTTTVEALNPQIMVDVTGQPEVAPIAEDAAARLTAALDAVSAGLATT